MMSKKVLILLVLIISTVLAGCTAANDAASIYNKALEKTEQVQRYRETTFFEIILKNKNGEYTIKTDQDIVVDRVLGISAGTVKVSNNKETVEYEIYDKRGVVYLKETGTEQYVKSPRSKFVPDIRERCVEILREVIESTEDKEALNEKIGFEKNEETGDVVIKSKIQNKKIENMMFEIVKEGVISEEEKEEVVETTVEKMKKVVEDLEEKIPEEEIKAAVNKQVEEIDREFRTMFENYKCDDFVYTITINKDGYLSREDILFKASEEKGEGVIEIKISHIFKGPYTDPINFPKLTDK